MDDETAAEAARADDAYWDARYDAAEDDDPGDD